MSARLWLAVSLLANVALAGGFYWSLRQAKPARPATTTIVREVRQADPLVKTNYVVRRQNLTWRDIESADYLAYVQNLRDFGCPEETIRDIILADVNHLFEERRKKEIQPTDIQWWTAEHDPKLFEEGSQKQLALEIERRTLLNELLGPDWEEQFKNYPSDRYVFGGPVLSALSEATQTAIKATSNRISEATEAYIRAQTEADLEIDPVELAKFQAQHDAELAKLLTPEQLEEFQLRYSPLAESMRYGLRGLEATPDEFRAIYRARAAIDQQLELLGDTDDPATAQRRKELEITRDAAINNVLPPDKREQYTLMQQPGYQEMQNLAAQFELPPNTVTPLYKLSQAAELEEQRITNDASLNEEQRAQALEEMKATAEKTMRELLGEEAFERLQPSAPYETGVFSIMPIQKGIGFSYE